MPLLVLAAAASFVCVSPSHHDGDAIRCAGSDESMRLHGIDAPEMPGACRPGRECTPGDPYAARDHLAGLTRGRRVVCEQVDTDHYGRRVVECRADGVNIACAMLADGYAVQRYGSPDCSVPPNTEERVEASTDDYRSRSATTQTFESRLEHLPWPAIFAWLLVVNIIAYTAFATDQQRANIARRYHRVSRVPEIVLLGLALIGGSIGAIGAQRRLHHKTVEQPFATILLAIGGIQLVVWHFT